MNSFRCQEVSKSFDGVHAVDDVTLEFPASGITALIGPNGAGKTTLLNMLTGFLRPNAGHCFLGECETTHLSPHRIARMGVARTFQDLRLIQQVSVLDNVMTARPNQRGERLFIALTRIGLAREERANRSKSLELLRFVGLADKANDLAGELSYGEQKLLTLSVCLATEAQILLLDEPVAGVAPQMVERILGLLRELNKQGQRIVFIEHDIEAVRRTAETVIVMDDGKIIAQGKTQEVLERAEIMEAYLG